MTTFITQVHNDLRLALKTRRGRQDIDPAKLPKGVSKEYSRMVKKILPAPLPLTLTLSDALEKRSSYEMGTEGGKLTDEEWGTLLGNALGKRVSGTGERMYPSGGALYPIETYIITTAISEVKPTVFHYNPNSHVLEKLWAVPEEIDLQNTVVTEPKIGFSTLVVFTSVWRRSSAKYGDFTYLVALMEAGHMAQNLQLVATAMGLKSRPLAGFVDEAVNTMLDIDTDEEQAVYSMIISR